MSIPAGLAEMNLMHFYFWYALGSLVFCGLLAILGNEVGDHLSSVLPMVHRFGLIALAVAIVAAVVVFLVVRRRAASSAT